MSIAFDDDGERCGGVKRQLTQSQKHAPLDSSRSELRSFQLDECTCFSGSQSTRTESYSCTAATRSATAGADIYMGSRSAYDEGSGRPSREARQRTAKVVSVE